MAWINLKDLFVTRNEWDSASPTVLYESSFWRVIKFGKMCSVTAMDCKTGSGSWDSITCPYNIPSNLRPKKSVFVPMITANGASCTGTLKVETNGNITVANSGGAGSSDVRYGQAIWFPGH